MKKFFALFAVSLLSACTFTVKTDVKTDGTSSSSEGAMMEGSSSVMMEKSSEASSAMMEKSSEASSAMMEKSTEASSAMMEKSSEKSEGMEASVEAEVEVKVETSSAMTDSSEGEVK